MTVNSVNQGYYNKTTGVLDVVMSTKPYAKQNNNFSLFNNSCLIVLQQNF